MSIPKPLSNKSPKSTMRIDYLTVATSSSLLAHEMMCAVEAMPHIKKKANKTYKHNFSINLPGVCMWFMIVPKYGKCPCAVASLIPVDGEITVEAVTLFKKITGMHHSAKQFYVKRVDVAVDVPLVMPEDLGVLLTSAKKNFVYVRQHDLGANSIYIGGPKSTIQVVIYDRQLKLKEKHGIKSNPCVRVEFRLRPKSTPKLPINKLYDVLNHTNAGNRISVYNNNLIGWADSEDIWALFPNSGKLSSFKHDCEWFGMQKALSQKPKIKAKFLNLIEPAKYPDFEKSKLNTALSKAVAELGLGW